MLKNEEECLPVLTTSISVKKWLSEDETITDADDKATGIQAPERRAALQGA